jgi:hypothetical protein
MIFSEEEEGQEVIMTLAECRDPTATSVGGEQEVERCGDVPVPRKCAAILDTIGEWEVKQTLSLRPLEASPASSPPAMGVAG